MEAVKALFGDGKIWSRRRLAKELDTTDRTARQKIQDARRCGIPIVALPTGGYKLAETEAEKRYLLEMYRGRAMSELKTYHSMKRAMFPDGQLDFEDLEATDDDKFQN